MGRRAGNNSAKEETMNGRIARGLALAVATAALAGAARAQDGWPSRPVRLISTSVAGGNIDVMCRIIAEKLSVRLGQPVVVDNKPGAATVLGTAEAAKAAPDGYTFLITIMSSMVGNRVLRANLPYDPVKDFEPVTQISTGNVLLVGPATAPYRDLKGFVEWAKKLGRPVSYGSIGVGTSLHLFGVILEKEYGVPLNHVPYKGEVQATADVMNGVLDVAWVSILIAKPLAAAGRVRALAITGPKRFVALAGASDLRRAGLSRIRDAGLGRRLPAGGNAQAHRRAARARDRPRAENARGLGAPDRDGAAADRQHARGVRRELPARFPALGGAHQGFRREGGMMLSADKNRTLTQVGAGAPMGELLRRYWQPVAAVSDLQTNAIKPVRIMGEDLVIYRDLSGTYGLIARHCRHRAADLAYGYVEQCGLRCHYHGWTYDEGGQCIAQPFEEKFDPQGRLKKRIRTTAYPVQAKAGLLWAYLGPRPAPLLPDWEPFSWKNGFVQIVFAEVPCNWLQCQENSIDPVHFEWMHENWSLRLKGGTGPYAPAHLKIGFDEFDFGFVYKRVREGADESDPLWTTGRVCLWPNAFFLGEHFEWRVPVDDENMLSVTWSFIRVPKDQVTDSMFSSST